MAVNSPGAMTLEPVELRSRPAAAAMDAAGDTGGKANGKSKGKGKGKSKSKAKGKPAENQEQTPRQKTALQEAKSATCPNVRVCTCIPCCNTRVMPACTLHTIEAMGLAAALILECKSWATSLKDSETPLA